tara:strand:+ start:313 stop:534 length:222 start_codon:yes stop_codon:yes gene_type:complete
MTNNSNSEDIGKLLGTITGSLVSIAILSTIIWAIIVYAIGFSVTWWQVYGVYIIYTIVKNSIINSIHAKNKES